MFLILYGGEFGFGELYFNVREVVVLIVFSEKKNCV